MRIDYKGFIEQYFMIRTKSGRVVPFVFNDVQNRYYETLVFDYPTMQGIRENDLKARQEGFSSIIDGIFTVDFIAGELGWIDPVSGQVISHKEAETKPLFKRIDLYLDSWLQAKNISRKRFLKTDNKVSYFEGFRGSELFVGTAGAKTLGRGGTLQNLHWSECGFYPNTPILNAKDLVTGAEQQVADGIGKIFRESTGESRVGFWPDEYFAGKDGLGDFKSRFFPWFENPEYSRDVPTGYIIPAEWRERMKRYGLTREQIYWYIKKIESRKTPKERDVMIREYPFEDRDAFLASGQCYFDTTILASYLSTVSEPIAKQKQFQDFPFISQYREIKRGEFIMIFADCAQGGSDANHAKFLSRKELDIPLTYHRNGVAAKMTGDMYQILQTIYDITGVPPVVAFERNNGGGSEMERLQAMNREGKYRIFTMPRIGQERKAAEDGNESAEDDDTENSTKLLGWNTTGTTRPMMCGDGLDAIESKSFTIYDRETIEEMFTFVVNERTGRPEADRGAHDDRVMSFFGVVQMFNRVKPPSKVQQEKDYSKWENYQQEDLYDSRGFHRI